MTHFVNNMSINMFIIAWFIYVGLQ